MDARTVLVGMALVATACGGGSGGGGGNPTGPSPSPGGSQTSVTIAAAGVNPSQIRIEVGQQVQFVNNASRNVQVTSDPHPTHELCPPLNDQVGMLAPGQSKTATFTQRGTCTYHDHGSPDDTRFRGSILIGVTEPGPAPDYRTAQ
jgi:plastocyanin